MLVGIVKWYDSAKGFGVIVTPNEGELFLHRNNFLIDDRDVKIGTALICVAKFDPRKKRLLAKDVRLFGEIEDWSIILDFIDHPCSIQIRAESNYQIRGHSFIGSTIRTINLQAQAIDQFLKRRTESEVVDTIIDFYDADTDAKRFLALSEMLDVTVTKNYTTEIATKILTEIFSHFGSNLNEEILFNVWKKRKFKYLALNENGDYEIPLGVLGARENELDQADLKRIMNYSYGKDFCRQYVQKKVVELNRKQTNEIKDSYNLIDYIENTDEKEQIKLLLDEYFIQATQKEIIESAEQLGTIQNDGDYNRYKQLIQLIPSQLTKVQKEGIIDTINRLIVTKSIEEFQAELWLKGLLDEVAFDRIQSFFIQETTSIEKRLSILKKLRTNDQFELLKDYTKVEGYENAFKVIEKYAKHDTKYDYDTVFTDVLYDAEFWANKDIKELVELYVTFVDNVCEEEEKYRLFLKGFVKNAPKTKVLNDVENLGEREIDKILRSVAPEQSFIYEVLDKKIDKGTETDISWIYELGSKYLDDKRFQLLDERIRNVISPKNYFNLWKDGKAKKLPKEYLKDYLRDDYKNYTQIDEWIKRKVVHIKEINDFLFSDLQMENSVTDRKIFYTLLNHIRYLIKGDEEYVSKIKHLRNPFYLTILWFYGKEEDFDFIELKGKFIYFSPEDQARIIKKLFHLKAIGKIELSLKMLDELMRFDLDMYNISLEFHQDIPIDLSTDVVIKALLAYEKNNHFIVESELMRIVLEHIKYDKTKRFKLSNYFERCLGRQIAVFDWKTNGKVAKTENGEKGFYFSIEFEYNKALVEQVKYLPERRWNNDDKIWTVPSRYENEVIGFAKRNQFYIDFEGGNYSNNKHLAEFKRADIPNGISFCEGRLSNKKDEFFDKEFYWCGGDKCYQRCESIHKNEQWEDYTLLDFLEILGLNTDSKDNFENVVKNGKYYEFIGFVNRFNRLLEHLYCDACKEMLSPADHGWFTVNNVIRFKCIKPGCIQRDKEIYLNHCLNGKCQSVIDSRISKQCPNEVYICKNCGTCCSHAFFGRRIQSININDFIDNPRKEWAYNETKRKYDNKLGHLEKGEYFCYKCQSIMEEMDTDVFICPHCHVKYDTAIYKIKRPHLYLRKNNNAT